MQVITRPDEGSWVRLPDSVGYLQEYREKIFPSNPPGRPNAMLYIQQHSSFQWTFEIWHTKTAFIIVITSSPFTDPNI